MWRREFIVGLGTAAAWPVVARSASEKGFLNPTSEGRWSMPTYEYMCKKCGPFTQLRPMAECELPSACPECGTRAPCVLLTAPGCLTMAAEARQAGAKSERSTDGLHDPPPYLRDPAGWTKKLKRAQKLKRARRERLGPPD